VTHAICTKGSWWTSEVVRLSTYAGGRGGRERAAKRSGDRPRGAAGPLTLMKQLHA